MRKVLAVVMVLGAMAPASARQCIDMGGGYVQCDDGSFGTADSSSMTLSEPDPNSAYGERRDVEHGCYERDGSMVCD